MTGVQTCALPIFIKWNSDLVKIKGKNQLIENQGWDFTNLAWNRELVNIVNAHERLQKVDWEKVIIVIWDWVMSMDDFRESRMIADNMYIAWKPVSEYSISTYNDHVNRITDAWIKLLPICIGYD